MKLNALDDLLSKRRDIFDPVSIMQSPKIFFRVSMLLFFWLGMMKTQTSYFAEKRPLDGNEM